MAQRPIWRGHLRLALVSCPVALYSARHDRASIRFHLINPDTGNRIRMVTVDGQTGDEVRRSDLVKGYEFRKNTYLLLYDEDFESLKIESTTVMSIEKFVEADSIDPIYYDTGYYLAPDGDVGADIYAVLKDAIGKTQRVALARVVIAQRERTIALRATEDGLVAHTLFEQRDIHDAAPVFETPGRAKADPEMVKLATQLIERQTGRYDPSDLEDRYETRLRALIDSKLKGEGMDDAGRQPEPDFSNVIDLMALLKKSLAETPATKEPPKTPLPGPAKPAGRKAARRKKPPPETPRPQPLRTRRRRA